MRAPGTRPFQVLRFASVLWLAGCSGEQVVHVEDSDDHAPAAGVAVVVNDAAGAVVRVTRTNDGGEASVAVPAGGSVSTYQTDGSTFTYVDTIVAPPAGVPLYFVAYKKGPEGTTTLELRLAGVPAGTRQLRYTGTCWSGTVPANQPTLTLADCDRSSLNVVVTAVDTAGKRLTWGGLFGQAAAPGRTVTKQVEVNRTDFAETQMEMTGVRAGDGVDAGLYILPTWSFAGLAQALDHVSAHNPAGGTLGATLGAPASLGSPVRTRAGYTVWDPEDWRYRTASTVLRLQAHQALPPRLSFAAGPVPLVTSLQPDLADPAHPRLKWQGTAPGDLLDVIVEYDGGGGQTVDWELWAPPDHAAGLRLPDVPPELAAYAPAPGGALTYSVAAYYDFDAVAGFGPYLAGRKERLTRPTDYTSTSAAFYFDAPRPTRWTPVPSGETADLRAVWVAEDESEVWVAGGRVLRWAGEGFSPSPAPAGDYRALSGFGDRDGVELVAVGLRGVDQRWDGSRWTPASGATTTEDLHGAWMNPLSGEVWTVGAGGTVLRGGRAEMLGTTGTLRAVWGWGAANVWIAGAQGTFFRYEGTAWRPQQVPASSDIAGVWGADADHVFAVDRQGRVFSSDGVGWMTQQASDQPLNAVGGRDANDVWAVGDRGTILRWDGRQWHKETSGTTADLYGVFAREDVWVVGQGGVVLRGKRAEGP